jgi:hypothetical protein
MSKKQNENPPLRPQPPPPGEDAQEGAEHGGRGPPQGLPPKVVTTNYEGPRSEDSKTYLTWCPSQVPLFTRSGLREPDTERLESYNLPRARLFTRIPKSLERNASNLFLWKGRVTPIVLGGYEVPVPTPGKGRITGHYSYTPIPNTPNMEQWWESYSTTLWAI